jgi:hypothetical protein
MCCCNRLVDSTSGLNNICRCGSNPQEFGVRIEIDQRLYIYCFYLVIVRVKCTLFLQKFYSMTVDMFG